MTFLYFFRKNFVCYLPRPTHDLFFFVVYWFSPFPSTRTRTQHAYSALGTLPTSDSKRAYFLHRMVSENLIFAIF